MSKRLLFLLLATLPLIAFSQHRINCDPNNRPHRDDCFGVNATYEPTCAYYSANCPFDTCARDVSNACEACSDPNVRYYRSRQCEPELVVSECNQDLCNTEFDPQANIVFEPVCGFRRDCSDHSDSDSDHSDCSRTFTNVCKACANSNYPWYQSGVCQHDKRSCSNRRRHHLHASSTREVCAFFDTQDGGLNQHTTVSNAYTACSDDAVNFYTRGECGGPNRDNTTYCLPNVRPEACTREYNPVCGFFQTEDQGIDHKIMSNPCVACSDSTIIYHQPGPCVFTCNRNPGIIFECTGTIDPVCGSYQDSDGQTRQISLKNGCIGCYNIPTLIDNYTDGLCPGDIGIRCENDAGGFLIGQISPVCGLFEEDCNNTSCRQTFSESVAACSDENVVLYVPGSCPGDEGVPCTNYRTRPDANSTAFIDSLVYNNVCGYREQGCEDSSCRDTFDDQYDACADEDVQYFTAGPCA